MKIQDYLVSVVRTVVPLAFGAGLAKLAKLGGWTLDPDVTATLTDHVTATAVIVCTAGWYAIMRALEAKWPMAGLLLGYIKQPSYEKPKP